MGAFALNAVGNLPPAITGAMENMTSGTLDFASADTRAF
jgi:hypothetical protein